MALTRAEQLDLVEQARREEPGRSVALLALLRDFRPFAMAVIHRTLAAAGVGHDHAEEAWLQASYRFLVAGLGRFTGDAAPRSYFLRIALHAAVDVVRGVRRRPPAAAEPVAPDPVTSQIAAEDEARTLAALRACLDALSEPYRSAVRLYYLEEAGSCASCAQLLGVATLAFMKRLERARGRLERCVRGRLAGRPGRPRSREGGASA